MKIVKLMMALTLGGLVSACASPDTATRNAPYSTNDQRIIKSVSPQPTTPALRVDHINVSVPQSLKVSERNMYYPGGDIVWREDPIGDRHAQVKKIFESAMAQGTAQLENGLVPVYLDVQVQRFHALTEKARYTTGGVHSITFRMRLRDAATGFALGEPRTVQADIEGFGGRQALQAEARGLTQKVRITNHLAEVIRQELTQPEGYEGANLGFMQAINTL
jgi:hypothetical protein